MEVEWWPSDDPDEDVLGRVDEYQLRIRFRDGMLMSALGTSGGGGGSVVTVELDAPPSSHGHGWGDGAPDIVMRRGTMPPRVVRAFTVEPDGERSEVVLLPRPGERTLWVGFLRHDGTAKQLICQDSAGRTLFDQPLRRIRSRAEQAEASARYSREQAELKNRALWPDGVLPQLSDEWDLVTVDPGQVLAETERFTALGITARRREPATIAHVDVYWPREWSADGEHPFDDGVLSRCFYQLPRPLQEVSGPGSAADSYRPNPSRATFEGIDRPTFQLTVGAMEWLGIKWTPAVAIEIVGAGIDPWDLASSLRTASPDEIAAFVSSHPREADDGEWWWW